MKNKNPSLIFVTYISKAYINVTTLQINQTFCKTEKLHQTKSKQLTNKESLEFSHFKANKVVLSQW